MSADEIKIEQGGGGRTVVLQIAVVAVALIIWFLPPPEGVTQQAHPVVGVFVFVSRIPTQRVP